MERKKWDVDHTLLSSPSFTGCSKLVDRLHEYQSELQQKSNGILQAKAKAVQDLQWVKDNVGKMEAALLTFHTAHQQVTADKKSLADELLNIEKRMGLRTAEVESRLKEASDSVSGLREKVVALESDLRGSSRVASPSSSNCYDHDHDPGYGSSSRGRPNKRTKDQLDAAEDQLRNDSDLATALYQRVCALNKHIAEAKEKEAMMRLHEEQQYGNGSSSNHGHGRNYDDDDDGDPGNGRNYDNRGHGRNHDNPGNGRMYDGRSHNSYDNGNGNGRLRGGYDDSGHGRNFDDFTNENGRSQNNPGSSHDNPRDGRPPNSQGSNYDNVGQGRNIDNAGYGRNYDNPGRYDNPGYGNHDNAGHGRGFDNSGLSNLDNPGQGRGFDNRGFDNPAGQGRSFDSPAGHGRGFDNPGLSNLDNPGQGRGFDNLAGPGRGFDNPGRGFDNPAGPGRGFDTAGPGNNNTAGNLGRGRSFDKPRHSRGYDSTGHVINDLPRVPGGRPVPIEPGGLDDQGFLGKVVENPNPGPGHGRSNDIPGQGMGQGNIKSQNPYNMDDSYGPGSVRPQSNADLDARSTYFDDYSRPQIDRENVLTNFTGKEEIDKETERFVHAAGRQVESAGVRLHDASQQVEAAEGTINHLRDKVRILSGELQRARSESPLKANVTMDMEQPPSVAFFKAESGVVEAQEKCKRLALEISYMEKKRANAFEAIKTLDAAIIDKRNMLRMATDEARQAEQNLKNGAGDDNKDNKGVRGQIRKIFMRGEADKDKYMIKR